MSPSHLSRRPSFISTGDSPVIFYLEGTPPSEVSSLRLILHRLYPSILPVSPSVQHPIYQSSREGKNALT